MIRTRIFATLLAFFSVSAVAFAENNCYVTREDRVKALVEQNSIDFIKAGKLKEIYADTVVFQDPLKTVSGYANVAAYLTETFGLLDFHAKLTKVVKQGNTYVAYWTAKTQLKAGPFPIGKAFDYDGLSTLVFDRHDRIVSHRDYFDQFALYRIIPGFEEKAQQMLNDYIISQIPKAPAQ